MPIFKSDTQAKILAALFLAPRPQLTLTELAERLGTRPSTIHHEIERLERWQFVTSFREGNRRLVSANLYLPIASAITEILDYSYGPLGAIRSAVNQIDGVDEAHIFGSWAARYSGVDGPPPSDIDVLLIGTVERRAASAVSAELTRRLGQDVNAYRVSTQMWESDLPDAFIEDVRANPLVELKGRSE